MGGGIWEVALVVIVNSVLVHVAVHFTGASGATPVSTPPKVAPKTDSVKEWTESENEEAGNDMVRCTYREAVNFLAHGRITKDTTSRSGDKRATLRSTCDGETISFDLEIASY